MSEHCQQERNIGEIQATIDGINKTLDRLGIVLEKIAAQGEQIKILTSNQSEVFRRLNTIEVDAEGDKVKIGIVTAVISSMCCGAIAWIFKDLR